MMTVKQIDKKNTTHKFAKAGFNTEKQMAFYLKRAFEDKKDIFVLNDIRLVNNNDVAQIDHLVIHPYGFIIIESKSISSRISVNKYGEWKRIYKGKESGMPSPVQQAKRQMDFLITFLEENSVNIFKENIATKIIGKPKYKIFKQDVLVAISDSGIIERDNVEIPEALKADLITDKIFNTLSKYKKDSLIEIVNPFASITYQFSSETIEKIANLLFSSHCSLSKKDTTTSLIAKKSNEKNKEKIKPVNKVPIVKNICLKCKSINIEIRSGKYGYYFKCLDCDGNTPIKHTCNTPNCKPKTRKRKLQFFKVCESCNIDELFWENKS
jgi:hypothetical protein